MKILNLNPFCSLIFRGYTSKIYNDTLAIYILLQNHRKMLLTSLHLLIACILMYIIVSNIISMIIYYNMSLDYMSIEIGNYVYMDSGNGGGGPWGKWVWNSSGHWDFFNNGGQGPFQTWYPYQDDQSKDDAIHNWMHSKLSWHRSQCATRVPYDNSLNDSFTPQDHEYICDKVAKGVAEGKANDVYLKNITGTYPDRMYKGKISVEFLRFFFSGR